MRYKIMNKFEIQIQYPNHTDEREMEQESLDIAEILAKFESISWRRQRVLQLQLDGRNTIFTVLNSVSEAFLKITLNAYAKSEDFEFKIESNIKLIFQQRELFGLMTRKNKEVFAIKHSTLEQVKASLTAFLNQDTQGLEDILRDSKTTSLKDAS
ncbi:hypothetical protein [Acinetobacter sp. AG3]|jgi:hypothetical protein|uniref:hypothetical protein n=1 Tax=unclassified Acinetobacter TaxID=196816 RepID=UPI001EF0DC23|nr:hypothetical protein [Acinetobacter sp. AG3]MCG7222286.1 hypothetical protein [Acinetobacter sp. AG3]